MQSNIVADTGKKMKTGGRRIALALAFLAGTLIWSRPASAQQYEIHLTSDDHVGDRYRLIASARHAEQLTTYVNSAPVKNRTDEFATELISSVTVLETTGDQIATKLALVIEKCIITRGGERRPLIDAGRIVIATREGYGADFKMDDVPVDPTTKKALSMSVNFDVAGISDDDVFGTREKKGVGDSWDINAAPVVKSLGEALKLSTGTGNVKGATTLEGVVKTGEEERLIVSAWLSIDSFSVPLPDGFKIEEGQVKGSFFGKFPVNAVRQDFEKSGKLAAWFIAVGPPDPKFQGLTIQGLMEQDINVRIEPQPKKND